MNKRGQAGEQMMIFVLLLAMLLIGGGIVGGVILFYGDKIDARGVSAEILNYQIRKCISENGLSFDGSEDVLKICGLNGEVMLGNEAILVCKGAQDMLSCIEDENPVYQFGSNFVPCGLNVDADKYPKCDFNIIECGEDVCGILTTDNQLSEKVLA